MKIITVNLPESYIRKINEIIAYTGSSRSELLRLAIRTFLIKELKIAQILNREDKRKYKTCIFDYCLYCDKKLDNSNQNNLKLPKDYKNLGLRFCGSCYHRFKDRSLDDLPEYLIQRIKDKLRRYKNYREVFKSKNLSLKERKLIQKLEKNLEKINKDLIFDYCIICDKSFKNLLGKYRKSHHNYEKFGLNFCSSCYKIYKNMSLDEFPVSKITFIRRRLKKYIDYLEKSKKKVFSMKEGIRIQKIEKELQKIDKARIFYYCIICGENLKNLLAKSENHEISGLKFCSSCYEKYKDKTIEKFPGYLIDRIIRKINAYRNYRAKYPKKKLSIKEQRLIQKLKDFENLKISRFYDYCINCERKLHNFIGKNHKFHKNYEIFELKFCCSCYEKFKDKSFEEFPSHLINKIKKKIEQYKAYTDKSNKSNSAK